MIGSVISGIFITRLNYTYAVSLDQAVGGVISSYARRLIVGNFGVSNFFIQFALHKANPWTNSVRENFKI